ncbi:cobinamide kinase / cobinamide phosphate guanyltransferase-domain containing protein [Nitzschia inconspicua]|uniref:Cobinamide kinase / cobinamide phosphate guanyltransferase-domain containing protein n=1 Tax=Nitzschia inconspicua TaxID=303405 RepID=A0A9K3L7T9_9STRA|nr:cobinamide kinase / cobinamide phosphate guanyltransferase-domain containing protein [Nitzschia inconspicua]
MATIYLVTGGARSGKSSYAELLCEQLSTDQKVYVATAAPATDDDDFAHRITKHQEDRQSKQWTTIEEPRLLSRHVESFKGKVVLVDCMTLWLTNFMMEHGLFTGNLPEDDAGLIDSASQAALIEVQQEFDKLSEPWNCTYIFVTNELGSGTHASTLSTRKFVDCQGWLNQYVAKRAQKVIHMVCGCPAIIKDETMTAASMRNGVAAASPQQAHAAQMLDEYLSKRGMKMDPKGYFLIKVDREKFVIRVSFHSCIINDKGEFFDLDGNRLTCHSDNTPDPLREWECRTAKEATYQILEKWEKAKELLCAGHAGYLGREVQKAEVALYQGGNYQQD